MSDAYAKERSSLIEVPPSLLVDNIVSMASTMNMTPYNELVDIDNNSNVSIIDNIINLTTTTTIPTNNNNISDIFNSQQDSNSINISDNNNNNYNNITQVLSIGNQTIRQLKSVQSHQPNLDLEIPCIQDLLSVLIECFLIIGLGYLSGRTKLVSRSAKDISNYLAWFALPAVIFSNIAQIDFSGINWSFLLCMFISKIIIFIAVATITLIVSSPINLGYAGALSIFATQSNDFALGYPLVKSLYTTMHTEMIDYLNLMAPIQLIVLNPIGIAMLEYHKSRQAKNINDTNTTSPGTQNIDKQQVDCNDDIGNNVTNNNDLVLPNSRYCTRGNYQEQQAGNQSSDIDICHNNNNSATVSNVRVSDSEAGFKSGTSSHQTGGHTNCGTVVKNPVYPSNNYDNEDLITGCATTVVPTAASDDDATDDNSNVISQRRNVRLNSVTDLREFYANLSVNSQNHDHRHLPLTGNNANKFSGSNNLLSRSRSSASIAGLDCYDDCASSNSGATFESSRWMLFKVINLKRLVSLLKNIMTYLLIIPIQYFATSDNTLFIRSLLTNPLIMASLSALTLNLTYGPKLPLFATKVIYALAASFAAPALFLIGISMAGKFNLFLKNSSDLILSSVLVLAKAMVLPLIMRIIVGRFSASSILDDKSAMTDFAFLYGTFPTAPTAFIIANQYNVLPNVISISMVLSTFLSAPLMLASAAFIKTASSIKMNTVEALISQTMEIASGVTIICALFTLISLFVSYNRSLGTTNHQKSTRKFIVILVIAQLVTGIGGILWYLIDLMQQGQSQHHVNGLTITKTPMLLRTLYTLHYVMASTGLIITRYVSLCLIATLAAIRYKGRHYALEMSHKLVATIFMATAMSFTFFLYDSTKLDHVPIESCVPTKEISLYVRLIFTILVFAFSMVMFSATIRSKNISRRRILLFPETSSETSQSNISSSNESLDNNSNGQEENSIANMPSEPLSVITRNGDNINLSHSCSDVDKNPPELQIVRSHNNSTNTAAFMKQSNGCAVQQDDNNNNNGNQNSIPSQDNEAKENSINSGSNHQNNFSRSIVNSKVCNNNIIKNSHNHLGALRSRLTTRKHINHNNDKNLHNNYAMGVDNYAFSDDFSTTTIANTHTNHQPSAFNMSSPYDSAGITRYQRPPITCCSNNYLDPPPTEAGEEEEGLIEDLVRHSALAIFMMMAMALNLSVTIQKLLQDQPFGTYRQIEILTVGLDYGQGLMTFCLYGARRNHLSAI